MTVRDLRFVPPSLDYRTAFAAWLDDWRGDPYDPYAWIFTRAWTDFDWYVDFCERLRTDGCPPELTVPLDAWWAFENETLVGELYLWYEPMFGDNHIGYKVRPSSRGRGIAGALLALGLARLGARGITRARLTCRETNAASAAVIERAGGVRLGDTRGPAGHMNRRYVVPIEPARR